LSLKRPRIKGIVQIDGHRLSFSASGLRTHAELTASEQRVAELAAAGITNREMAAALFISPKTVEANLSRIYRKLSIRSRAELGGSWVEATSRGNT
jgi:DNA-binding CsgD family transcriptional regulator